MTPKDEVRLEQPPLRQLGLPACSVNYIDADVNSYYVEYIGKLNGCCGSFGWKRCATLENAEKVCNKFYGNCFDES